MNSTYRILNPCPNCPASLDVISDYGFPGSTLRNTADEYMGGDDVLDYALEVYFDNITGNIIPPGGASVWPSWTGGGGDTNITASGSGTKTMTESNAEQTGSNDGNASSSLPILVGVAGGVALVAIVSVVLFVILWRRRRGRRNNQAGKDIALENKGTQYLDLQSRSSISPPYGSSPGEVKTYSPIPGSSPAELNSGNRSNYNPDNISNYSNHRNNNNNNKINNNNNKTNKNNASTNSSNNNNSSEEGRLWDIDYDELKIENEIGSGK